MDDALPTLPQVPIFPLPHGALLPGELLPLHIFEPRYRRMLEVVRGGDRLLGIATLLGACSAGDPPVADVIGVGRLVKDRQNKDGTSDIVLHGLARGEILSEVTDAGPAEPFRRAQVMLVPHGAAHATAMYRARRELLHGLAGRYPGGGLQYDVAAGFDAGALADRIASALDLHPDERVAMLQALDVDARCAHLLQLLDTPDHRKRLAEIIPSLGAFGLAPAPETQT